MNLTVASQKRLLILWAFAIGWFYLGSLINFHQHHIWGKSLIPQINACSRSKGKSLAGDKNGGAAGFHLPLTNDIADAEIIQRFIIQEPVYSCLKTSCFLINSFLPPNEGSASSHLRGPPQA
jgi:hypothetical protein